MPDSVTVPDILKGEAAEIWRTEFLRAYDETCQNEPEDERDGCSAAMAWTKVKKTYKKGVSGKWVAKSKVGFSVPVLALTQKNGETAFRPDQAAEQYPSPLGGKLPTPARLTGKAKELWEKAFVVALTEECTSAINPRDCAIRYAWEQLRTHAEGGSEGADKLTHREDSAGTVDRSLLDIFSQIIRGGPGSGHAEHSGRPGEVGGSQPGQGGPALTGPKKGRTSRSRRRYFNKTKRMELATRGWALPWGGFPIEDFGDLKRAIRSIGLGKDRQATIAHIIRNAKRLGKERVVPRAWWAEAGMEMATRSLAYGGRVVYMTSLVERREFSEERRKELAGSGKALPWGGFPIENCGDVKNAVQAIGRAKDRSKTIAHIKRHASRLGCTRLIPKKWGATAEAKSEDIQAIYIGKTMLTELDLERRVSMREMAELSDQEILASFGGDVPARRPDEFDSLQWRAFIPELRTLEAVIWRRHCERTHQEALENAVIHGWIAEQSPSRNEYVLKHWQQTPEGVLLKRAILVRKAGSDKWFLREVGQGASMSFAVKMPPNEIRLSDMPRVEG